MTTANSKDLKNNLPDWTRNAVFLYGPKKGGTTLVQNLIDGTPYLLMFPSEVKFKWLIDYDNTENLAIKYLELSRVRGKKWPNFNTKLYNDNLNRLSNEKRLDLKALLRHDAYNLYLSVADKPDMLKMWGMKEVGGRPDSVIEAFRQRFPAGKMIFILRRPIDVTGSKIRSVYKKRKGSKKLKFHEIKQYVNQPYDILLNQLIYLNDPNIHFVTYEHLTGPNPSEALSSICDFLNVPYNQTFEKTTIFGEPIVASTSTEPVKYIFKNKKKWSDGLKWKDRLAVIYYSSKTQRKLKKKGHNLKSYDDILQIIISRNKKDKR